MSVVKRYALCDLDCTETAPRDLERPPAPHLTSTATSTTSRPSHFIFEQQTYGNRICKSAMDPGAGSSPTAGHELVLHEPDGVFAMNDNFPSQHAIRTGVTGETTSPTTARQSLFPATTLSSPSARSNDDTSPPSMSAEQLDTVHRPRYSLHRPLSTLTGRSAPLPIPLVGSPNQSSSSPLRTRIPRIEKDVDDPSTPLQTALSPDHGTPTTLSRLFAMRSGAPDSRSTSYNTNVDSPARDVDERLPSLAGHLYTQGLLSGKHSDITVVAFGCSYKLHRLMLSRSPFFNTALSGQWLESNSSSITLHPEDVDCNINKTCFELALKRLYGAPTPREEIPESIGLFATGCWLEMTDLIDSSIKFILNNMNLHTLSPLIRLVTNNYYGRAGDKILASAKAMLCRDGWRMPLKYWDKIPADIVREIVGGDGFFVDGEWERWLLTRRIVLRRLRRVGFELGLLNPKSQQLLVTPDTARLEAIRFDRLRRSGAASSGSSLPDAMLAWVQVYAHPDVEPLLVLMDEGIHYMHLDFERLQGVRAARDPFAVPLMPDKVLSDALWMQMELRENILNSPEGCMELGLSQMAEPLEHSDAEQYSPVVRDVKGKQLDGELLTSPTTIRPESKPHRGSGQLRRFWIPSTDCSIVMGGNAGPVHTAPTTSNLQGHALRMSSTMQHENVVWTSDFGAASAKTRPLPGLRPSLQSTQHPSPSDAKPIVFTRFPPFRFSADFPNPRLLKEKKRVYSRTIFYAGSLWNIYIQKVKTSRNSQLGVYLHRAKEREVEAPYVTSGGRSQGSVDERIGLLEREMLLRHTRHRVIRHNTRASGGTAVDDPESSGSNEITGSASGPQQHHTHAGHRIRPGLSHRETRQTSDEANASSNAANHGSQASRLYDDDETSDDEYENTSDDQDDLDNTFYGSDNIRRAWPVSNTALLTNKTGAQQQPQQPSVPTLPPYVDARPTIKTYFKIYSPSKGGRMLSVYESAPDRFNFSQSWGWKSSTLMLDEGMDDGSEDTTPVAAGGGADNTAGGRGAAISPDEVGAVDEESSGRGKDRYVSGDGRLRFMVVIGNV